MSWQLSLKRNDVSSIEKLTLLNSKGHGRIKGFSLAHAVTAFRLDDGSHCILASQKVTAPPRAA